MRLCKVSVRINRLHAYAYLWLSHTSYSFWSIGLACEITRSLAIWLRFVAECEGNGLPAKFAVKELLPQIISFWLHKEKWWTYQKGNKFCFSRSEFCTQSGEVILKSNQCNKTEKGFFYIIQLKLCCNITTWTNISDCGFCICPP